VAYGEAQSRGGWVAQHRRDEFTWQGGVVLNHGRTAIETVALDRRLIIGTGSTPGVVSGSELQQDWRWDAAVRGQCRQYITPLRSVVWQGVAATE
jgi:hypothetical protein